MWLIKIISHIYFYTLKTNHRHKIFGCVPDNKKLTVLYKMKFCIATHTLDKMIVNMYCTRLIVSLNKIGGA